jgi:hypothetical protein
VYLGQYHKQKKILESILEIKPENFVNDRMHMRKHQPSHFSEENLGNRFKPEINSENNRSIFFLEDGDMLEYAKKEAQRLLNMHNFIFKNTIEREPQVLFNLLYYNDTWKPEEYKCSIYIVLKDEKQIDNYRDVLNIGTAKYQKIILFRTQNVKTNLDTKDMGYCNTLILAYNGKKWHLFCCKTTNDNVLCFDTIEKIAYNKFGTSEPWYPQFGENGEIISELKNKKSPL